MKIKSLIATLLSLFLFAGALPSTYAAETEILVEGENYIKTNKATSASTPNPELSNGDYLLLKSLPDEKLTKEGYIAMYKVNVPEAGSYYMDIVSSPYSLNSLSPYMIRINNGEYFNVNSTNSVKTGDFNNTSVGKDLFYKYRLNPVTLRKGVNTIFFRVTEGRVNDGRIWFMLDCFKLTKAPWNVASIDVDAPFNVFEETDDITATIKFVGADSTQHQLSYTVSDYFGNTVSSKDITIQPGTDHIAVDFGAAKPGKGHYTISASVDGLTPIKTGFSVLTAYAERTQYDDTPFAMDVAAGMLFSIDKLPNYARALRLMGVNYVRERIRWSQTNPGPEEFDFGRYNDIYNIYQENGIKVLELNHSTPTWLLNDGGKLPNDLVSAYNFGRAGMQNFANADWEFWNEPDISFTADSETADYYAAYMKAVAIGAHSTGSDNDVSWAGIAYPPGNYMDLLMQNDLMPYIDVYNFHAHRNGNSNQILYDVPPAIIQQITYLDKYENWDKKIFLSECGNTMPFTDSSGELNAEQQKAQARYVVTSTLTSLSMGVDKHFWFILPYYVENNSCWGIFTQANTPLPAVNAESTMTKVLGKAVYAGELSMPEGVSAYVFANGDESTAVFWSEKDTPITIRTSQSTATKTDIMGNAETVNAEAGVYNLTSGPDATYLTVKGAFDGLGTDYFKKEFKSHEELTDAQKVVLRQIYPDSTATRAKAKGYIIDKSQGCEVKVEVANLSDKSMTGTINGTTYGGWSLDSTSKPVSLAPHQSTFVSFRLNGSDNVLADVSAPVIFKGLFGSDETSKSTAIVLSAEDKEVEPDVLLPKADDVASWRDNYSGGSTLEKTNIEPGVMQYKYVMGDGDKWAYPVYNVPKDLDLSKSAGLVFDIYFENDIDGVTIRSFANENNGSSYLFLNGFQAKKGWNRIKMPWVDYSATSGVADDNFHLDIDQIKTIQIGMNTRTEKNITYQIKNIGVYSQDSGDVYTKFTNLVANTTDSTTSITSSIIRGQIALRDDTIKLLVDGKQVPFTLENDNISATVSLTPGEHSISIRAFDITGKLIEQVLNLK